jgi:uncharacterized membrane protein
VITRNERHRLVARRCVIAGLLLLAASSAAAILLPWNGTSSAVLALALLPPLLAPLGGIARGDRRTHAWATLCVVPGFLYGLTESVANPSRRPLAALVLGASLLLFFALVAYLRVTRPPTVPQVPPRP